MTDQTARDARRILDATWKPARPGDTPGELVPEHGPTQPIHLADAAPYDAGDAPTATRPLPTHDGLQQAPTGRPTPHLDAVKAELAQARATIASQAEQLRRNGTLLCRLRDLDEQADRIAAWRDRAWAEHDRVTREHDPNCHTDERAHWTDCECWCHDQAPAAAPGSQPARAQELVPEPLRTALITWRVSWRGQPVQPADIALAAVVDQLWPPAEPAPRTQEPDSIALADQWIAASGIPVYPYEQVRAWLDRLGVPVPVGIHPLLAEIRRAVIAAGDAGFTAGREQATAQELPPGDPDERGPQIGYEVVAHTLHRDERGQLVTGTLAASAVSARPTLAEAVEELLRAIQPGGDPAPRAQGPDDLTDRLDQAAGLRPADWEQKAVDAAADALAFLLGATPAAARRLATPAVRAIIDAGLVPPTAAPTSGED